MKRLLATSVIIALFAVTAYATPAAPEVAAPSAVLIERSSGKVLYEKDSHNKLRPASVTKIMSLLLIMEAVEDGRLALGDIVTASEHAASMGGSQIFLEQGEKMSIDELLKCVCVSSANDACVALAEHLYGSESTFVSKMNERAAELGMTDTHFENCTGLDADGHLTTAHDIALMSNALLSHDIIKKYTTIWMDTIRNGAFGLSNTNKLVKFYPGATGLKTGYTSSAGYCLSASAERDGMELVAVIMKAETSPKRNADASNLLNFGFANYTLFQPKADELPEIQVKLGTEPIVCGELSQSDGVLVEKPLVSKISEKIVMFDEVEAPVEQGQKIGVYSLEIDGEKLSEISIVSKTAVERKGIGIIFRELVQILFMRAK